MRIGSLFSAYPTLHLVATQSRDPLLRRKIMILALALIWIKLSISTLKRFSITLQSPQQVTKAVTWFLEHRGGLAWLLGFVILPSQFSRSSRTKETLIQTVQAFQAELSSFKLSSGIHGFIYYPPNWTENKTHCIVYHNPNDITVEKLIANSSKARQALFKTPGELTQITNCPILIYDYRGTGLSQMEGVNLPTYASIVRDGKEVLQYALEQFDQITIVGSSLGGGVGTVSLYNHLEENPSHVSKIKIFIHHDSFSKSTLVYFPFSGVLGTLVNFCSWIVGGHIDAEKAMNALLPKGTFPIAILTQQNDSMIPQMAQMAKVIQPSNRVSIHQSPTKGHANLSKEAKIFLSKLILQNL